MRRLVTRARAVGLVLATALALPACEATRAEQVNVICTAVCRCVAPALPGLQQACVEDCAANINIPPSVTETCLACISSHTDSCDQLERDCEPLCSPPQPVPNTEPDGGS